MAGNDAGIGRGHVKTDTSPIKEPTAGTLLRFTADGKKSEIIADGFRNPYDLTLT